MRERPPCPKGQGGRPAPYVYRTGRGFNSTRVRKLSQAPFRLRTPGEMPIKKSGAIAGGWQRHHTIVRVAKGQNMVHDYSRSQTNRANKPRECSTACLRRRSELAQ